MAEEPLVARRTIQPLTGRFTMGMSTFLANATKRPSGVGLVRIRKGKQELRAALRGLGQESGFPSTPSDWQRLQSRLVQGLCGMMSKLLDSRRRPLE